MTNLLSWKDEYAIGVLDIDEQHQYLFSLINKTIKCQEKEPLQNALMELYKYTREHFQAEEQIMRDANYPDYEAHIEKHHMLINTLNEKSSRVLEAPNTREDLNNFLVSWLVLHILHDDMAIGEFLAEQETK